MKTDYLERQGYPTDLTDEQWATIAPLFVGMREYKHSKRELTNAVLYLVDSGCKWRQLPHVFPLVFIVHLSKDYEIRTNSAEAMIKLSHIHALLKRL